MRGLIVCVCFAAALIAVPAEANDPVVNSSSAFGAVTGNPADAVQYKIAHWHFVPAGDCVLLDATLTLGSNGSVKFEAVSYTNHTHSGDTWRAGIQLQDKNGVYLSYAGEFDSPRMDDGNGGPPPHYSWGGPGWAFDKSIFNSITQASLGSTC